MHFNVFDVLYSQFSHKYVSAAVATIFRVMLILQEYKGTDVVVCVVVTP
jgi:hypothetical protein